MILFHLQNSNITTNKMKPLLRLRHRTALLVGVIALASSPLIQAQSVPDRIDYQGRVLDGNGTPLAAAQPANYEMEFRIYDADTVGTLIWAEKQLVTVNKGQYSVRLGEGQAILSAGTPATPIGSVPQDELENAFNGSSRHLGITVKIPGQTPGEVTPRLSFLSSPFALKAGSAATLNQAAGTSSNLIVGSLAYSTLVQNITGAVDGSKSNIVVNAATQALTTTLPLNGAGKELVFTKQDATVNVVTVAPPAGGSINGSSTPVLLKKQGDSVSLRHVSADAWWIVSLFNVNAVNADTGGNVAIPGKLTVTGGVLADGGGPGAEGISNNGYAFSGNGGDNDSGLFSTQAGTVQLYTDNAERMRINDKGAIGIGTGIPAATVHIIRNAHTAVTGEQEALRLEMPGVADQTQFYRGPNGNHYIRSGTGGQVNLQDLGGGNVVIGSQTIPKAKLHVAGSLNSVSGIVNASTTSDIGSFAFYARNPSGGGVSNGGPTTGSNHYSIYAEQRIAGLEFNAFSDVRIKNIVGVSDGASDLTALMGIQVTDYTFRDTLKNGKEAQKKVVAQQVEKVFPIAVSKSTDVVPDIMKKAEIIDGWVALSTDLKKSEKVRLLAGKDTDKLFEVLEVKDGKFRVSFDAAEKEVFVYGREVNDFRTVDYDAISMLNVSATQQVKKDSDSAEAALRAENEALKAQLTAQQKRLAALEQEQSTSAARLAALEAMILKSEKNVAASQPENAPAGKARLIKF